MKILITLILILLSTVSFGATMSQTEYTLEITKSGTPSKEDRQYYIKAYHEGTTVKSDRLNNTHVGGNERTGNLFTIYATEEDFKLRAVSIDFYKTVKWGRDIRIHSFVTYSLSNQYIDTEIGHFRVKFHRIGLGDYTIEELFLNRYDTK